MKKILISCAVLISLLSVTPVHAALDYSGLVKCDGVVTPGEEGRKTKCDFNALISMANSIISWLFMLSIPIFVGLFAYAGFLYMQPSSGSREKANTMLWVALKGFVIMLVAWMLVATLLKLVVDPDFKGANTFIEKK